MSNMIYNNMINNYLNNYMRGNLTNTKSKKTGSNTNTAKTGNIKKNSDIFDSDKSTIKFNTINSSKSNSLSNTRSNNVKIGGVQEFISRNPKEAYNVRRMLAQGKFVKNSYPAEKSNSEMTMDEYKEYIMDTINKLPRDISQLHDDITVNITEEGWETMKADSEYEAWVLGYFKEDFAVKIPYNGMGTDGINCVEHFGASIGEHHGESVARTTDNIFSSNNLWWNSRDDKMRLVLERNNKRNKSLKINNRNILNRSSANIASIMSAYESGTIKNTRLLGNSMIRKKK
ncbi:MAG: hypothetical protein IJ224_08800 [Lachnospiraceae bacterium]|nr:hypothetical protein [Lachnospiraceae bacterium]